MAESLAEQLAAALAQIERLSATLEERDHTISQLRRENQELSKTVATLQAQTLREPEAALSTAVRVPSGESHSQPTQCNPCTLTSTSVNLAAPRRAYGAGWWQACALYDQGDEGPQASLLFLRTCRRRWGGCCSSGGRDAPWRGGEAASAVSRASAASGGSVMTNGMIGGGLWWAAVEAGAGGG